MTTPTPNDYHVHTYLCKHATGDLPAYSAAARRRGLSQICFADHAPAPCGYDAKHRMTPGEFAEYLERVRAEQEHEAPQVLLGIEADYYEGCEAFLSEWLPAQEFDLVLGSVHYIGDWGFDCPEYRHVWRTVDVTAAWRQYFGLVGRLVDTGLFDAVAHLDLPKKFGHRPADADLREMAPPALDRIARAGMAIEINTGGLRKPVQEMYPSPLLLSLAHERGIPILFGSDAHAPEEVGYAFAEAVALARQAGYTHSTQLRKRTQTPIALP